MSNPTSHLQSGGQRALSGVLAALLVLGLLMLALAADSMLNTMIASAATAPAATTGNGGGEHFQLSGDHVSLYNLAGEVVLEAGRGSAVEVTLARGGRDAAQLQIQTGAIGGRQTLRVRYPSDHIIYPAIGFGSNCELHVRDDGTFGDSGSKHAFDMGRRMKISGSGSGTEAHANLRIAVPAGRTVDVYLGAGTITASNVDGTIRLETASGDVESTNMKGSLVVDTGSGGVGVSGMVGALSIDTGSGDVTVSKASGGDLLVDTGSGSITGTDLSVADLNCDTGSGDIRLRGVKASSLHLDVGSGSVDVGLVADTGDLMVDTGSGNVTLRVPQGFGGDLSIETGSGDIETEMPITVTRHSSDALRGTIGDGRGQVVVETGSGNVQILAAKAGTK